ncbi:MAG TPA: serine/threonine-protein kinase, partial [Ktedonobacteraceae bacterium]
MSEPSRYQDAPVGPYRLIKLLGVGPVSRVYLAERQDWPGRQVALKLFESVPLPTLEEKDQTLDEIRLLACMEHPAILPTLDDGLYENILYLVTPYIGGETLRQRLTRAIGDPLPVQEALAIIRQIGEALHFAHTQRVVHANLKPENIFLQSDGKALLADFLLPSLAKSERAARILSSFAALYMAPEQFRGITTPLSDQYALACLTYELLTGKPPFEAEDS